MYFTYNIFEFYREDDTLEQEADLMKLLETVLNR